MKTSPPPRTADLSGAATASRIFLLALVLSPLVARGGPSAREARGDIIFEDPFSEALREGWSWVRERAEGRRLRDGALEIRAEPGNMWGPANNARNVLVRPLPDGESGPVACEVNVSSNPTEQWEQAGIVWYSDDSNMVKLVKELVDGKTWIVMGREERDRARTLAKIPLATDRVDLRLVVRSGEITGHFRADSRGEWRKAASCGLPPADEPKVSLQTYNGPAAAEHWARFSRFRIFRPARSGNETAPEETRNLKVKDRIGVNIHFTGAPEKDLRLLEEAGFGWIRMDMVWEAVERTKGKYDFAAYDRLVEGLDERGIRALFILDYSNRLYEEDRSVRTAEGRAAFARFAAAAASRYRGKGIRWEVWNEPNHPKFWKPQPAVADYLELTRAVSEAVRAADREARVLGPATSGIPWEFLEELFRKGFLELVDEVSVHPYRGRPPETVLPDYARLRGLIREHTPAGKTPPPVVSGEWGYSNWHWGKAFSPELQAAYLARQFLTNISEGVTLSIWYDWANDGKDPRNTEHNFGTVTAEREPKPAYRAVKTLTTAIGDARFLGRLESAAGEHLLLFATDDAAWLAAWTEDEEHSVRVATPGLDRDATAITLQGDTVRLEAAGGRITVDLTPAPVCIRLPLDAAQGKVRVLGDGEPDA